ncbi:hypothetical protein AA101099_1430 [Neoasaia chiangmaiensis NBRC 101099]|uniref:Uncharacterized protein n=1 Tax=Neoasaia chiangmaiensis TaxID=320497 RepID=A0A1U9KQA5_9PROT|nr:hypothetical protein [Neoasaia chiangmaiensis]AQS87988.1 hypothetical protein A0U93_08570 [Neoasaia chiangmaiensis]GBR38903.1 hypothetical protein AA101099_1430 [Neoasaia chiangmaiensis NBRC 101099]GEN15652.1 hypothetical protein NCH01_20830 [Neoasaia chiangmaiensis]
MLAEDLTRSLLDTLERPDLRTIAGPLDIRLESTLPIPFRVADTRIRLGRPTLDHPELAATILRHAIELGRLRHDTPEIDAPLAVFTAARIAALFHDLDANPAPAPTLPWLAPLRQDTPPDPETLARLWPLLAAALPDASISIDTETLSRRLARAWPHLGPTESLMAEGGDARLKVDPQTGLNRYGCSHRPRPWAITFASSTASSLSERGFGGAENARRTMVAALLHDTPPDDARQNIVQAARRGIARCYSLDNPEQVLLAASGTDCELAVLAIAASHADGRPITNILVAPDETGSGVPLAAAGRHFAADAANGHSVGKGQLIDGFPQDTRLIGIPIRQDDGTPRSLAEIDAECIASIAQEIAQGRHVVLHQLDMSKTGLIGPSAACLHTLQARHAHHLDIVVDACQARLEPTRIRDMVARGIMVMITGSKFFTGPPFCGAVLLPPAIVTQLAHATLPAGLRAYAHRGEWPRLHPNHPLDDGANLGLALRWHAALAEMNALAACPPDHIRTTLQRFLDAGRTAIDNHPDLTLLEPPKLDRPPIDGRPVWDDVPTILSFLIRDPHQPHQPLELEDARRLHRWLNADLSPWLAGDCAARLCHLGQPVPVNTPELGPDRLAGALRLCAGARLVSGEPSHAGLNHEARLTRELADAQQTLQKIALIREHWDRLHSIDPVPHYAPVNPERKLS